MRNHGAMSLHITQPVEDNAGNPTNPAIFSRLEGRSGEIGSVVMLKLLFVNSHVAGQSPGLISSPTRQR